VQLSESVDRILRHQNVFGELFYAEFFRRCPEARDLFENHDMKRQALVMTMTLQSVQQFHDGGYPAVDRYVEHLGGVHRRRAIPMTMYPHFRAAMLHTLAKLLADVWSTELRTEWELALDKTVRRMLEGYEHPRGV
jgi:hemoglobin-like flavoprotein